MLTRRQWLRGTFAAFVGSGALIARAQTPPRYQVWLPLIQTQPTTSDGSIIGPATGTTAQASAWFTPRTRGYTASDIVTIVNIYQRVGADVNIDWFLALAQMSLETGSLTSWWCQPPRRNPAGIGVTGRVQAGSADQPPGPGWVWDGTQWCEGWSFATWDEDAVVAHLGRLLAYALKDDAATAPQLALIKRALAIRPLPTGYRLSSPAAESAETAARHERRERSCRRSGAAPCCAAC